MVVGLATLGTVGDFDFGLAINFFFSGKRFCHALRLSLAQMILLVRHDENALWMLYEGIQGNEPGAIRRYVQGQHG